MKLKTSLLTFCLFLLVAVQTLASNAVGVAGTISIKNNQRFLVTSSDETLIIQPLNEEIKAQLGALRSQDTIKGFGTIVQNNILILEFIDFVGLRKLLGGWQSRDGLYRFTNFENLTVYNFGAASITSLKSTMKYALTPSSDSQWKLFLVDNKNVNLANLDFVGDHKVIITFLNNTNGETNKKITLSRTK